MTTKLIPLLALLATTPAVAERAGGVFTVPAESVDAGGSRATGGVFQVDQSLGGIGDIATSASFVSRGGYPGQLTEPTNVVINAPAGTNLNESSTLPLNVLIANNDGTVSPSGAAWSVASGPLLSVNTTGLVTAGAVYANTGAVVQAVAGGFTATRGLLVLNTNPDNFGLYAGDNVDDAWQVQFFGTNSPKGLGSADPDGDGQFNAFEFLALTSPLSLTSRFDVAVSYLNATQRLLTFQPRQTNRLYQVEQSVSLLAWSNLVAATTNDAGVVRNVTDLNATSPHKSYRVRLSLP
jgi:hypothetical protein